MKLKKLIVTSLALLLCLTSISSVSAYSTANKKNKSTISMENIKWSQNFLLNNNFYLKGTDDYYHYGEEFNNINTSTQLNKITIIKQDTRRSNVYWHITQEHFSESMDKISQNGKTYSLNIDLKITLPQGKDFTKNSEIFYDWDMRKNLSGSQGVNASNDNKIPLRNNEWQSIKNVPLTTNNQTYSSILFGFSLYDLPVGTTIEWKNVELKELLK